MLFHQGAPALGEGALRTGQGLAALRAVSADCLSPAGQLQVATALEVTAALETRLHAVRHQLLDAARHLAGEGAGRAAVRGRAGRRAGDDLLAGRGRPVLLLPPGGPVRRAGRHRLVFGPQRTARAAVPAGTAGAALGPHEAGKYPRPRLGPDDAYYAPVKDRCNGKRAALSEARKILRQACHILTELGDDALAAA